MKSFIFVAIVVFSMFFVSCDFGSAEMIIGSDDYSEVPDEVVDEATDENEKPDVEKPDNEVPDEDKIEDGYEGGKCIEREFCYNDLSCVEGVCVKVENTDPTVSLSGPVGIDEGKTGVITVTLDKTSEYNTTMFFQLNPDGTDTGKRGDDYKIFDSSLVEIKSFQFTIPAGQKNVSFVIENLQNGKNEGNKKVTLRLISGSNYVEMGNSQIAILLYDDDDIDSGIFSFASTSAEVFEGSEVCVDVIRTGGDTGYSASVMVQRNAGDLSEVTINPSGDYVTGVIYSYNTGVTVQKLCLTAKADNIAEGNEVVEFKLAAPSVTSSIDGTKNTFKVTIKDASSQTKEIVGDKGKELLCTFTKDYGKCHAGSTVFSISKEYTYHIWSFTFYCDGMIAGDALHCETAGYDYSTDKACTLPGGGVGYTWNEDGCQ